MKKIPVLWMDEARADLDDAFAYIYERHPSAANHLFSTVHAKAFLLSEFPGSGRPGRVSGTRELFITDTHYFLVYTVEMQPEKHVIILRVLHDKRQWPETLQ